MWYKSESNIKPDTIDVGSSQVYVYVRKNITETVRENEETSEVIWTYDEARIPKDIYDIFKTQEKNTQDISDIEEVVAEILYGGE